jgi:putative transcriptional regulator
MNEKAFENFNLYKELGGSLEQAIAFKKGDKSKGRIIVREIPTPAYSAAEVRRIRATLHLSQNGLATALGVSKRTVEAWETGKNTPSNSSNKLLYLIEKDNSLITQLVTV